MNPLTNKTTVSVNQHEAFKRSLYSPADIERMWGDMNQVEHLAADPIHDHAPETRQHGKIRRVLDLLDNLQGGKY